MSLQEQAPSAARVENITQGHRVALPMDSPADEGAEVGSKTTAINSHLVLSAQTARYESILRRLQEHKQQLGFCGDLGEQEVVKQLTAQAGTPPLEPENVKPVGIQQGASAVMTAEPIGRRQVHSARHCMPAPGAACGQVGELAEASALQTGMAERRQAQDGVQHCARTRGLEVDGWRVLKKSRLMWRQPRLHMEDILDLDDYMARHPLFSRYDKRKGRGNDGVLPDVSTDASPFSAAEGPYPHDGTKSSDKDQSMEQLLVTIEALQVGRSPLPSVK
eukprot:SM000052S17677  [mRNA]  locus=s52:919:2296:- [translate_table: standard]